MLGAGCRPEGALDLRQLGRLSISCDQSDALIFVDDHHVGTVAALRGRPLAMRPGARRLELRRDGFFSYYRDLQVVRGQHERLAVKLRRTPF